MKRQAKKQAVKTPRLEMVVLINMEQDDHGWHIGDGIWRDRKGHYYQGSYLAKSVIRDNPQPTEPKPVTAHQALSWWAEHEADSTDGMGSVGDIILALEKETPKAKKGMAAMTVHLELAPWVWGELNRAAVNLGCSPEETFKRFLAEDDDWNEALIAWGQKLEGEGKR